MSLPTRPSGVTPVSTRRCHDAQTGVCPGCRPSFLLSVGVPAQAYEHRPTAWTPRRRLFEIVRDLVTC